MELRIAEVRDVPALATLEEAVFGPSGDAFTARQIRYLITKAKADVFVAVEGGQVLGWVVAVRRSQRRKSSGRIYTLTIGRAAQGRGVGRALLGKVLEALERRGITRVSLEVAADNDPALALYHRLGFRVIGELSHYYGREKHAWHMLRSSE